jgi:putative transposase
VRDEIDRIIARSLGRCDARLIAHAVLSNHYHIIIRQGVAPLSQLMQPINREIALVVQRDQKRKGHVFQGRFRAKSCVDADQLREWIVYTHRNAVRAGLCSAPGDWKWCTHRRYIDSAKLDTFPLWRAIELFADNDNGTDGLEGYQRYMEWRDECDRLPEDSIRRARPRARFGDRFFAREFTPDPTPMPTPESDLRDVVLRAVKEFAPGLSLDDVRALSKTRDAIAVRHLLIEKAVRARHRPSSIARFLNVSETMVSRVAVTVLPRPPVRFDS